MNLNEKKYLLDKLTETHIDIQSLIEGVDLDLKVYSEADWRIRDLLGHIATWDREITRSLKAFMDESEYLTPDLDEEETDFNQRAIEEQRSLSTEQIVTEWKQARVEFKEAISAIPEDRFPGDLLYPWGDERGDIARLVEYMIEHDEEHRDEIAGILQSI